MCTNAQFPANFITSTVEILNWKLLYSVYKHFCTVCVYSDFVQDLVHMGKLLFALTDLVTD